MIAAVSARGVPCHPACQALGCRVKCVGRHAQWLLNMPAPMLCSAGLPLACINLATSMPAFHRRPFAQRSLVELGIIAAVSWWIIARCCVAAARKAAVVRCAE